ncbi:MAG: glutathione S-transferase family protein [Rhodospirillaceae bacterium]|nr:glutathione S-transferase family protein [Rhodospirillaceae bacterium]
MAALTVYGSVLSPFVARVLLACAYKDVPTQLTMPKDGIKSPEYLKLNPFGKIPAIKDGAFVLYESAVIVDYLDSKYKKKKLLPAAPKAMAQVRLIATVTAEYVQGAGLKFFRMKRSNQFTQADLDAATAELHKGLDVLEKIVAKKKKYIAGPTPTLADCFVVPALFFAVNTSGLFGIKGVLDGRPKLKAYWDNAQKDKVAGQVLKGMTDRMKQLIPA